MVNYVETRKLDQAPGNGLSKRDHYLLSRQFTDGLGRSLMVRSEAEPAAEGDSRRVVVTGAVQFNARQKPRRVLNPFFTRQTGGLDELLAFENTEAPAWSGQFHERGSLVTLDLEAAHQSSTEYDATLRTTRETNQDGSARTTEFEPLVIRVFDENDTDELSPHFQTPKVHTSDGLGRVIRVDELVRLQDDGTPSSGTHTWSTSYQYDLNDRLTRVIDSQNNVKTTGYDGLKRKMFMDDPDCGRSTYVYDSASNLIESVDAKRQRIRYTYDGANRILTEDYADEDSPEFSYRRSPDVILHYDRPASFVDAGDGTAVTARNTKGVLAYVEDTSGEEHISYDARGRVEWTVKRIPDPLLQAAASPVSYQSLFEYDSLDRMTRLVYPDQDEVRYEYNHRGMVERIIGGPAGTILSGSDYSPANQQVRVAYGNGVQSTYAYDARARLAQLVTQQGADQPPLLHLGYAFDAVSNLRTIEDHRTASALAPDKGRHNSQAFAYDDLYRITRVRFGQPDSTMVQSGEIHFRYDRIGNMLVQASTLTNAIQAPAPVTDLGDMGYGGTLGRFNRAGRQASDPAGPHALTSIRHRARGTREFSYDNNGNLRSLDGLRCTWDYLNRLVAVEDEGMRAEYRYDFTGRRVSKRVMSKKPVQAGETGFQETTTTLYVGNQFEVREHDQPTKFVFNGSTRVARIIGSLSNNNRIQRLRLRSGWNLVSLAVTVTNLAVQLARNAPDTASPAEAVFQWNPATGDFSPLVDDAGAVAGSVLWIKARTNACISVCGAYAEPVRRSIPAGGGYIAASGLEAWDLDWPATLAAWGYSPEASCWRSKLNGELGWINELPGTLAPGGALYAVADVPVELEVPDPSLRITFYHQDHLGSSSVITDAQGQLVQETAYLPFGEVRFEYRPRKLQETYQFTQKERDRESGFHYFGSRYLAGQLSRFITPDPKYAHPDMLAPSELTRYLVNPQKQNIYAYVVNNPVSYTDPSGLDEVETVDKAISTAGFAADVADGFASGGFFVQETDDLVMAMIKGNGAAVASKVAGTALNVAGVALKTAQLINDPTENNAVQAMWEGEKWAITALCAPAGLVFQAADLTGYGPSAYFEATYKAIETTKQTTRIYNQTAKVARATTQLVNKAAPRIEGKLQQAGQGVQKLHQKAAEIRQETAQMNADIRKLEIGLARQEAELKSLNARIQKLEQD
ncbi:MAG: RHS repeat-associated core domain-containing protein [Verrucomicrobiia bacterium]